MPQSVSVSPIASFAAVMGTVAFSIVVAKLADQRHTKRYSPKLISETKQLIREANFSQLNAQQSSDPLFRFTHATQALAQLDMARRVINSSDLMKLTGIDIDAFASWLEQTRDEAMSKLDERFATSLRAIQPAVKKLQATEQGTSRHHQPVVRHEEARDRNEHSPRVVTAPRPSAWRQKQWSEREAQREWVDYPANAYAPHHFYS